MLRLLWWRRPGKQNDLICNSGHFIPLQLHVPSISLALHLVSPLLSSPSLLAVGMLCLPTISALWCTQEEECCSAMHHMHIASCGMLHPQITHSVLGAKAVAHNKTAILIASDCACSLFRQTKQRWLIMSRRREVRRWESPLCGT